jgi:adenine-specific DNA-methyltransferase
LEEKVMTHELTTCSHGNDFDTGLQQLSPVNFLNRVLLGDCQEVLAQLPPGCADVVITDPPYVTKYRDRQGRTVANDNNADWIYPAFAQAYRALKPDAFCISFYGWNKVDLFLNAWCRCGFRPVGHFVWVKNYCSSTGYSKMCHECAYLLVKGKPARPHQPIPDVLPWNNTHNKLHPTQKPVASLVPLVEAFSKPGQVVLDPFGGSGSTGVAALKTGRSFILIEKEKPHFALAQARLRAYAAKRTTPAN